MATTPLPISRNTLLSQTVLTPTRLPHPLFFCSPHLFLFLLSFTFLVPFYIWSSWKQIISYWLADFNQEPSNHKTEAPPSLASLLTNFANICHCCVAKETSLAVQKVPGNAAITRPVWTWCNLSICFTCITYAAQAVIKICISHTIHFIMM